MKKVIFALILIAGTFGAMSASADTRFSIGWTFGHHGDVTTHIGISETRRHHRSERRHHRSERHHRRGHVRSHHSRGHWGHDRRHYRRPHSDAHYYHLHDIHRYCSHH